MFRQLLLISSLLLSGCVQSIRIPEANEITETKSNGRYAQLRNHFGDVIIQTDRFDYEGCRVWAYMLKKGIERETEFSPSQLVDCSHSDQSKNLPYLLSLRFSSSSVEFLYRDKEQCLREMAQVEKSIKIYDRCTTANN